MKFTTSCYSDAPYAHLTHITSLPYDVALSGRERQFSFSHKATCPRSNSWTNMARIHVRLRSEPCEQAVSDRTAPSSAGPE